MPSDRGPKERISIENPTPADAGTGTVIRRITRERVIAIGFLHANAMFPPTGLLSNRLLHTSRLTRWSFP